MAAALIEAWKSTFWYRPEPRLDGRGYILGHAQAYEIIRRFQSIRIETDLATEPRSAPPWGQRTTRAERALQTPMRRSVHPVNVSCVCRTFFWRTFSGRDSSLPWRSFSRGRGGLSRHRHSRPTVRRGATRSIRRACSSRHADLPSRLRGRIEDSPPDFWRPSRGAGS